MRRLVQRPARGSTGKLGVCNWHANTHAVGVTGVTMGTYHSATNARNGNNADATEKYRAEIESVIPTSQEKVALRMTKIVRTDYAQKGRR